MASIGPSGYLSIAVAVIGVLFYLLAVGGVLFEQATAPTDIGLIAVTLVLVTLGLFGIWAHLAERKQQGQ